jgi:hypothetical protein
MPKEWTATKKKWSRNLCILLLETWWNLHVWHEIECLFDLHGAKTHHAWHACGRHLVDTQHSAWRKIDAVHEPRGHLDAQHVAMEPHMSSSWKVNLDIAAMHGQLRKWLVTRSSNARLFYRRPSSRWEGKICVDTLGLPLNRNKQGHDIFSIHNPI